MSLNLVIRSSALNRRRARAVASQSRSEDVLELTGPGRFHGEPALTVRAADRLLAEDAQPGVVTWSLDAPAREALVGTLDWLYDEIPGELALEVFSEGEEWELIEKFVDRGELRNVIETNRLAQRTVYFIRPR